MRSEEKRGVSDFGTLDLSPVFWSGEEIMRALAGIYCETLWKLWDLFLIRREKRERGLRRVRFSSLKTPQFEVIQAAGQCFSGNRLPLHRDQSREADMNKYLQISTLADRNALYSVMAD